MGAWTAIALVLAVIVISAIVWGGSPNNAAKTPSQSTSSGSVAPTTTGSGGVAR